MSRDQYLPEVTEWMSICEKAVQLHTCSIGAILHALPAGFILHTCYAGPFLRSGHLSDHFWHFWGFTQQYMALLARNGELIAKAFSAFWQKWIAFSISPGGSALSEVYELALDMGYWLPQQLALQ